MVYLTMTPAMIAAIKTCHRMNANILISDSTLSEPSLQEPSLGRPISHGQIITVAKYLREQSREAKNIPAFHLEDLLRGSRIYIEPPKPRKEPTSEYKALMAHLRREEELRAYERMINPAPTAQTAAIHISARSQPQLFSPSHQEKVDDDDEVTYADINRQMALIINITLSIVACSVAIWLVARHWSTPSRLGLSMGGSGIIGLAEAAVYAGYLRRIREAKEKGKKDVEVKEIIKTWIISGTERDAGKDVLLETMKPIASINDQNSQLRRRM